MEVLDGSDNNKTKSLQETKYEYYLNIFLTFF